MLVYLDNCGGDEQESGLEPCHLKTIQHPKFPLALNPKPSSLEFSVSGLGL